MNASRIPAYDRSNPDGALFWFSEMCVKDLLFNPDDSPKDIIRSATGDPTFTPDECDELEGILAQIRADHGYDGLEKAVMPVWYRACGLLHALDC